MHYFSEVSQICQKNKMSTIFSKCLNPIIVHDNIYPCGQCPLCRRNRMLEWVTRGTHELFSQNNKAIFVTFTYNEKKLPRKGHEELDIQKRCNEDAQGNLRPQDMTLFWKRLRKYLWRYQFDKKIKYIYCGEYGERRWRPHYHAVIYGLTPSDITSDTLERLWGLGKVDMDANIVTEHGLQYVVGYVSKKILNRTSKREDYFKKGRLPPFLRVSKGIGAVWAQETKYLWTKTLTLTKNNTQIPVPRYYIKKIYKEEGVTIKYNAKIFDKDNNKILNQKQYKLIKNPNGHYTNIIFNTRHKRIKEKIIELENDVTNENYFEDIMIAELNEKKLLKEEKEVIKKWHLYKSMRHNNINIEQALYFSKCKQKRNYLEDDYEYHEIKYQHIISHDYFLKEKEKAKNAVYKLLNGAFGKRQNMEIQQELLGETI